jgi:glutathione synthase/RimK-type ligase-like ATP-grasp enzyme
VRGGSELDALAAGLRSVRDGLASRYRRRWVEKAIASFPDEAVVPLEETADVLLLCSSLIATFDVQVYLKELAFAQELAARNRPFAVSADPSTLFEKSVAWFLPGASLVAPRLWDYSRQVTEFAAGLERQANRLFCSSAETAFWENKAHMHRAFDRAGVPTPATRIVTADTWRSTTLDFEPLLIKKEHSAGSAGIRHFDTAAAAASFLSTYRFRPTESLIVQEVVTGATRDLRLTMVGDAMVERASYWRTKSETALSAPGWTSTATTFESLVDHRDIPPSVVPLAASYLKALGVRTAGIDLMWVNDDLSAPPLFLELSPYYQPNPPKPERYADLSYKQFKQRAYAPEGYFVGQHQADREVSRRVLEQGLF